MRFLNHLEKDLPTAQEIYLIMDNYCTHKGAEVQRWLKSKKRNRFHFHFTPTSSSMAEPGRALLCPDHRTDDPKSNLSQHRRPRESLLQMAGDLEWRTRPIYLARLRGRHPRQGPPL